MKSWSNIPMSWRLTFAIFLVVFCCATCIDTTPESREPVPDNINRLTSKMPQYPAYAGTDKCASCHKSVYSNYIHTAHHLTSDTATAQNIRGSFADGANSFSFSPAVRVQMEKRDSGLYQVVYQQDEEKMALPFNYVIGSGTKGQTFIYWRGDYLLQMPITYFTVGSQWANSPGFPERVVHNRPITSRCLECHATFAAVSSPPGKEPETFDRKKMMLGIGCEKCHGPASAHVAFHQKNPAEKTAQHIINPASLSREQNMDLCALCHGGRKEKTQPSFSFVAGDTLSNFFKAGNANIGAVDVHGNQVALLQSSKCYTASGTMTCLTCHSPHQNERGQLKTFSQRCMSCHQTPHKPIPGKQLSASALASNCIDCHMPARPSRAIVLQTGRGATTSAEFRTHLIDVYREEQSEKKHAAN